MKFSISTSFYRRSHLVENLYKQILDQTHTDWEWIVTDDFSDYNNAEEILREICAKDPRVKYYNQSRKKECFYNPQRGCTGDIVIQFDSDDYAYPKILEIYNHFFLKHPEVAGISCLSHTVDANGNWIEIQGGGTYDFENSPTFNYTPMGRAWRNIIDEFDNGILKWYQNDTNIVRHVETKGKWLYLPRVLYKYYYSQDTFSREPGRTAEQFADIENERLFIESKFPYLNNPTNFIDKNVLCNKPAKFKKDDKCYCLKHSKKQQLQIPGCEQKPSFINKQKIVKLYEIADSNNIKYEPKVKKADLIKLINDYITINYFQTIESKEPYTK